MNTSNIEDQIISTIQAIPNNFPNGACDTLWTQKIKLSLGMLGRSMEFGVCTSGVPDHFDGGEWLFDLCWYESNPKGELLELLLALESEWDKNYEGIKYDFEKLLIAKCKLKVMIFQASGSLSEEYFTRLKKGIRTYKGSSAGEIYLLACFDEDKWQFIISKIEGT